MITYQVLPNLYVSNFPSGKDVMELQELGITVVVNLVRKKESLAVTSHFCCVQVPLPDSRHALPHVPLVVDRVKEYLRSGETVLVHCHAGRNRAALVAGLVFQDYSGCSGRNVIEYVRSKRPNAFHNEDFVRYLEERPC